MPFERSGREYFGDRCTPIWRVYSHAAADGSYGRYTGKDMRCLWQDGERLHSEADRNDDFKGKYASTAAEEIGRAENDCHRTDDGRFDRILQFE